MNSYTIEGDGEKFDVVGSIKKDGVVKVTTNDSNYEFRSEQGSFKTGATSARLVRSDGSYIDEGAVSQTIRLPDGTKIEKGAVSKKVTLPNGKVIEPDVSSNEGSVSIQSQDGNIKIQFSSSDVQNSSSNVDIDIDQVNEFQRAFSFQLGNVEDAFNRRRSSENEISEENSSTEDTVDKDDLVSALTPGFFTLMLVLFGVFYSSTFALFLGSMIYMAFAIPVVVKYAVENVGGEKEESAETINDTEAEVENLKDEYLESDMTTQEFETELEDLLEEDRDELELELN